MEYQVEQRIRKTTAAGKRGQVSVPRRSAAPNSALTAAYETNYAGIPNLEAGILSRLPGKPQPQIPAAENEADRLSAGIAADNPAEVKRELGSRLGADFSAVRFHTDAGAAAYSDQIGARAYTTGSDVYFGTGGFEPSVAAHELVHTVQQGAVGSGAATMTAPSGGIQMLRNPFRRRRRIAPDVQNTATPPGTINADAAPVTLKKAAGSDLAAVAQVSTSSGNAVLKTRDNPELEAAVADFYNAGGSMFKKKRGGWSFDAPGVRGLQGTEREQVKGMFGRSLAGPKAEAGETAESLANRAALYQFAGGTSRADPRANSRDNQGKLTGDPGNLKNYQKTMGRIALMDLITGNTDRIFSLTNYDNWTEERDSKRIHLIDNAYEHDGGMAMDAKNRTGAWETTVNKALGKGNPGGPSLHNFFQYTRDYTGGDDAAMAIHGNANKEYQSGVREAAGMLPQLYERLSKQYGESSGGHMNEQQTELLRRVQAVNGMLNPAPKRKWWKRLFGSRHGA